METTQAIALMHELDDAHNYIMTGRRLMAEISELNAFYAGPLLLYAYGFERLLKAAILLRRWETTGRAPDGQAIRQLGHDFGRLRQTFVAECCGNVAGLHNDVVRSQAEEDRDFLTSDACFQSFLDALGGFAGAGRYHHLSKALGLESKSSAPDDLALKLEKSVGDAKGIHRPVDFRMDLDEYYCSLSAAINQLAEQFHRAIGRLFLWGVLGQRGRLHSGSTIGDVALHGWSKL